MSGRREVRTKIKKKAKEKKKKQGGGARKPQKEKEGGKGSKTTGKKSWRQKRGERKSGKLSGEE